MATVISGSDNFNTNNVATQTELDAQPIPIGEGQTWKSVARSFNTTYTNTTGRPIVVVACGYNNSGGSANHMRLAVDGTAAAESSIPNSTAYTEMTLTAIVPNGSTYIVTVPYGSVTGVTWRELS